MTKHEILEEDQKKIVIPFRSLIDTHSSNNNLPSAACPKDWPFSFSLNTIDRQFILFAQTSDECKMWMSGFKYAVQSTKIVQNIMIKNNQEQDK